MLSVGLSTGLYAQVVTDYNKTTDFTKYNVNYGVDKHNHLSSHCLVTFLLAQKGAKTIVFEPAFCVIAKKGYPDPVSLRDGTQCFPVQASPPLAGQRGQRFFILAGATRCALSTDNHYFKIT